MSRSTAEQRNDQSPLQSEPQPVLVSIHDVMPDTLKSCLEIIELLESMDVDNTALLVVPGVGWTRDDVDTLKDLQGRGYTLAGHGWLHQCGRPRTWWHRFHSFTLSRNVAEHLSITDKEIAKLVEDCYGWFVDWNFELPTLYVPPAWAMGRISQSELPALPFYLYEYASGVLDVRQDRFHWLPLLGYEADTSLRWLVLKCFNSVNSVVARSTRRPLRISIHPFDLQFKLEADLRRVLEREHVCLRYDDYF